MLNRHKRSQLEHFCFVNPWIYLHVLQDEETRTSFLFLWTAGVHQACTEMIVFQCLVFIYFFSSPWVFPMLTAI